MRFVNTILTLLLLIVSLPTFAQNHEKTLNDTTHRKYVIWYSPSEASHVYGLMLNFWAKDEYTHPKCKYPKIYGAEFNLMPLGALFPPMLLAHSLVAETHQPMSGNIDSIDFKPFKKIYGLQIGFTNMEPSIINGIDINATGSFESVTNGITISGIMNKHYIVNGITIAAIGNHDIKCNGIQIGLFNSCKQLKGIQIGLWNKNQKRTTPLINWSF
jgi:hypothetical protein